jgi:hypothetical protein
VRSAEVEDILEACKYKDGESERTHSKAMSIGDMTTGLSGPLLSARQNPSSSARDYVNSAGCRSGSTCR